MIGASARPNGPTRPRVLVIDDDDGVREILRRALSDEGFAVATVPHGAAALELVKHHPPAVILLDPCVPIIDGRSFLERYRWSAKPPASVVLLCDDADIEESAQRLRADGFIRKPLRIGEVCAAVRRCISAS